MYVNKYVIISNKNFFKLSTFIFKIKYMRTQFCEFKTKYPFFKNMLTSILKEIYSVYSGCVFFGNKLKNIKHTV